MTSTEEASGDLRPCPRCNGRGTVHSKEVVHGTLYAATRLRCRCDLCSAARRDYDSARLGHRIRSRAEQKQARLESAGEFITLHQSGLTIAEIAAKVNRSINFVAGALHEAGYQPRRGITATFLEHGTRAYKVRTGCRCDLCRAAVTREKKEARQRRHEAMLAGQVNPPHGSTSTYSNYTCRCDLCRAAWSVRMREQRQRRKPPRGRS
jgi:hypothetical protein